MVKKYSIDEALQMFFVPRAAKDVVADLKSCFSCKRVELYNGAYMKAEKYRTKIVSTFEAHKRYVDLQIMLEGSELIHLAPITDEFEIVKPYDEDRDIEFLSGEIKDTVLLRAGECCFIDPSMAHMPGMVVNGVEEVKKIVIKLPVL